MLTLTLTITLAISLDFNGEKYMFMPDSSLILYGFETPFIVCEVAVSQTLKSVMAKKRPYLLGSKNMVRFLIIIHLQSEKPSGQHSGKRTRDSASPRANKRSKAAEHEKPTRTSSPPIAPQSQILPNCPGGQYKFGQLFVYTTSLRPSNTDPSRCVRFIRPVVENLV